MIIVTIDNHHGSFESGIDTALKVLTAWWRTMHCNGAADNDDYGDTDHDQ